VSASDYNTLIYIALHCITLHYNALHYNTLRAPLKQEWECQSGSVATVTTMGSYTDVLQMRF
jgi:hypothetical protein